MSQYAVTIVLAILLLGFVVYQQMRTRPIRPRQLVIFPVILAFLGLSNLSKHSPASTAADVALGASVLTAILFGVGRGLTTRIWREGGVLVRKGTIATLLLWVVGLALRLASWHRGPARGRCNQRYDGRSSSVPRHHPGSPKCRALAAAGRRSEEQRACPPAGWQSVLDEAM